MPQRIMSAMLAVLSTLLLSPHYASAQDKPHILYVTVDDLGWKDVGYHGSTIQTPNIDQLAKNGFRLEKFYVQPFSGQTRAKYPIVGGQSAGFGPQWPFRFRPGYTTWILSRSRPRYPAMWSA